jgi:thiamine biosynthesis lipoprotein
VSGSAARRRTSPRRPGGEARFAALGTTTTVVLDEPGDIRDPAGDTARLAAACTAARIEIARVDAACSRFRPDSELIALDRAAGRAQVVSPTLFAALELAVRAAEVTGGAVDPTLGSVLAELGYDRDFRLVPRTGPAVELTVHPSPDWRAIELDPRRRTVRLPAGTRLDLGATAKAWCADRAARAAAAAARAGVLVGIGGDIAIAGPVPDGGWPVQLSDDHAAAIDPAAPTVALTTGGLATSGTAVRRWVRGGRQLHHVIDPATGAPAAGCWTTATVAAGCCADANIASTAAIVMGDAAPAWLAGHGLPARLVGADGRVTRVGAWPADGAGPDARTGGDVPAWS